MSLQGVVRLPPSSTPPLPSVGDRSTPFTPPPVQVGMTQNPIQLCFWSLFARCVDASVRIGLFITCLSRTWTCPQPSPSAGCQLLSLLLLMLMMLLLLLLGFSAIFPSAAAVPTVHDTPLGECSMRGASCRGGGGGTTVVSTTRNLMRFQTRHRREKTEEYPGGGTFKISTLAGEIYLRAR